MNHRYEAKVECRAGEGEPFTTRRYSRAHLWRFDGGAEVPASSSPLVVPAPLSDEAGVDPEEALVGAQGRCPKLVFPARAARHARPR
jgi:organic hydroperoxide reductase OsmC/OhrA